MQETADHLGIAKSTYAGYESGYREPSLQALSQLADLFETTVDYILGRSHYLKPQIDLTERLDSNSKDFILDGNPLTTEELIGVIAFIRAKREIKKRLN
jgi:transcriptional regulator with XRE-family HTH domain